MIPVAIVLATVASYGIAWLVNIPVLVPILNTAASFPFMVLALRRGNVRLAVARMLLWALAMGVCATLLSYARPTETDALFVRGAAYRTEMFAWVMTGRGAESTPSEFIPQQAAHAADPGSRAADRAPRVSRATRRSRPGTAPPSPR